MDKEDAERNLTTYYERFCKDGAHFFVGDEPVAMQLALQKAVEEETIYMGDYIIGETGKISEVRLDRIDTL